MPLICYVAALHAGRVKLFGKELAQWTQTYLLTH